MLLAGPRRSKGHHDEGRGWQHQLSTIAGQRASSTGFGAKIYLSHSPFYTLKGTLSQSGVTRVPRLTVCIDTTLYHAECASLAGSMPQAPRKMIVPTIMGPGKPLLPARGPSGRSRRAQERQPAAPRGTDGRIGRNPSDPDY